MYRYIRNYTTHPLQMSSHSTENKIHRQYVALEKHLNLLVNIFYTVFSQIICWNVLINFEKQGT